jgi:transposase-like protein
MSRNYRTYTKEFKMEALELLESSGQSAAQIERDLGITAAEVARPLPGEEAEWPRHSGAE